MQNRIMFFVAVLFAAYNLGQGIVEKLAKLSKIDFSMECFTADFSRDFTKSVKIWLSAVD